MNDLSVGDVIEWRDGKKRRVLRVAEQVPGGVRALSKDSPPGGGVLLADSEIAENVTVLLRVEDLEEDPALREFREAEAHGQKAFGF